MLADDLTKDGRFPGLLVFWRISKLDQKPIRLKMLAPRREDSIEHDLVNMTVRLVTSVFPYLVVTSLFLVLIFANLGSFITLA